MGIFQRFRCLQGRHQRDRKAVWLEEHVFHSRCSGCGRPMARGLEGWRLIESTASDPLAKTGTSWSSDMRG